MRRAILVIPCYNEERRLDVASLRAFEAEPSVELLFVNDGSTDGTGPLLDRLAADPRLGVPREVLADAVANPLALTGSAASQVNVLAQRVQELAASYPAAVGYRPGGVL